MYIIFKQEVIVEELGKIALQGLTPTCTKIVFTKDDFYTSCGKQTLSCARDMGIICKKGESLLQFFHKSGQEYCCAMYLSNSLDKIKYYLESIKKIKDALNVAPVLKFAASSKSTAKVIIEKLLSIFQSQVPFQKYYDESLLFDDMQPIQQFIELCLHCNFEANATKELTPLLADLFPEHRVFFIGISSSAAVSLAYYLNHCGTLSIRNITFRPTAHASEPGVFTGPVRREYNAALQSLKVLPDERVREIGDNFITSNNDLHDDWTLTRSHVQLVAFIPCIQACEGLPSSSETNIVPIISSFKHIRLETFDIRNFKLGDNFDHLLDSIEHSDMKFLLHLNVTTTTAREQQMTRLMSSLPLMPLLRYLDVSYNKIEAGKTVPILADNLKQCQALEVLKIRGMKAPAHDMEMLARSLPSQLIELSIDANEMNDAVALRLINTIPQTLIRLHMSMNNLSVGTHDEFLHLIHTKLTRLQSLYVFQSSHAGHVMKHGGRALTMCYDLDHLLLSSTRTDLIPSNCVEPFINGLEHASNIKTLYLFGIRLDKKTFEKLAGICRKKTLKLR